MIACIITVSIALVWLGFESDWLRVNLMGNPNTVKLLACSIKTLELPINKPLLMLDTVHFKPSTFTVQDMPEFKGDVNIYCKRE